MECSAELQVGIIGGEDKGNDRVKAHQMGPVLVVPVIDRYGDHQNQQSSERRFNDRAHG